MAIPQGLLVANASQIKVTNYIMEKSSEVHIAWWKQGIVLQGQARVEAFQIWKIENYGFIE